MNATKILTVAAFAALASLGAQAGTTAGEGDNMSPYAQPVSSGYRSSAAASAGDRAATVSQVGEGDRQSYGATPARTSEVSRNAVRAEAITAARTGHIEQGEG